MSEVRDRNSDIENLKDDSKMEQKQNTHGGARPGAGRPKGSMNEATRKRLAVEQALKDRIARNADKLLNAQLALAQGTMMLFRIHTNKKGVRGKPELVTDEKTIARFLDENEGMSGTLDGDNSDYFFITTKLPDNKAIESMLDRTFGRAVSNVDVKSDGEKLTAAPLIVTSIKELRGEVDDDEQAN